jgi:seryl-tRNA synthetase
MRAKMEAPKCRLCHEKHWGACPAFAGRTPSIKEAKQIARIERSRPKDEIIVELEAEVRQLKRQLAEANARANSLSNSPSNMSNISSNTGKKSNMLDKMEAKKSNTLDKAEASFDKGAYQREYMRRRREARKQQAK